MIDFGPLSSTIIFWMLVVWGVLDLINKVLDARLKQLQAKVTDQKILIAENPEEVYQALKERFEGSE